MKSPDIRDERPHGYYLDLLARGLSLVEALGGWAAEGFPVVSDAVLFERSCHCALCPSWDAIKGRCLSCGCYSLKHHMATERCPLGKWPAVSVQRPGDPSADAPPPAGN